MLTAVHYFQYFFCYVKYFWTIHVTAIPTFLQVKIYKPNGGKGCLLGTSPPPLPPAVSVHLKHFAHETLPKKLWRKYSYASLFVTNIKAKTPKITLYTKRAKFQLMENSDVEVIFYNGEHKAVLKRCNCFVVYISHCSVLIGLQF